MQRYRFLASRESYLFVALCALVVGMGVLAPTLALLAESATDATVSAASGQLPLGVTRSFPINVTNVQDLGAATIMVDFNPAHLVPIQCTRNPAFSVGLCNLRYDHSGDGVADAVRYAVSSLDGVDVPVGEQLPMVWITWQVTGTTTIGASSPLSVTVLTFTDSRGIAMPASAKDGTITIVAAPTPTPTGTPTKIPAATPTRTPTPTATAPPNSIDPAIFLPSIRTP